MEETRPLTRALVRFGIFEVNLRAGELRRNGSKVKLQEQPFQILAMLLERPGEVVTREEMKEKLWPSDTFVDFEHSINAAVKRLREALGDDADNPRFVETLHRRGYRFIAPVEPLTPVPSPGGRGERETQGDQPSPSGRAWPAGGGPGEGAVAPASSPAPAMATSPLQAVGAGLARPTGAQQATQPRRWWWMASLVAAVVIVCAVIAGYWLTRPLPSPRITRTVQLTNDGRKKVGPLVTDGTRLYFKEEQADGRLVLVQLSAAGGETVPFPKPFEGENVVLLDVSPDGSEMLVGTNKGLGTEFRLWILPVLGGSPRRVGGALATGGAAWSPDGANIVYTHGSDLYVMKNDGTDARKLVSVSGVPSSARWSPDGRRLRFTLRDPQTKGHSIWEVSADGTDPHPLLRGWSSQSVNCNGRWTPEGKYYIFSHQFNLFAIRERSGLFLRARLQAVQLTAGPMRWVGIPSRDGKKLFVEGFQFRGELTRYDAKSRQFAPYLSGVSASDLAFSRDGQWVAYVTYPEGMLCRSKLDGTERLQLTLPPLNPRLPRWSPDGKRIAFMAWTEGKTSKIYVVSMEGGTPQQLMPGERNEADPHWSPDGNSILFGRWPNYIVPEPPEAKGLHLLDLKTNQVSKIPGSEGLYSPRWSPDGRHVATLDFDSKKLMLFDFVTHQREELASSEGGVGFPNWSHDGKYVYVEEVGSGIFRVRVSDHRTERVVTNKELGAIGGVSGLWNGVTPDDSMLVMRDRSTEEIYALEWEAP